MTYKPLRRKLLFNALMTCGVLAGYSASAGAAECDYTVANDWGQGATAAVQITNNGSEPIDGWSVEWAFENNTLTNSWNADVSGGNSFTASDLGWNAFINPGETVEFGLQVAANGGPIETPEITGEVCTDGADDGGSSPGDDDSSDDGSTDPGGDSGDDSSSDPGDDGASDGGTVVGQECNWFGTNYPLCDDQTDGWGWENNQSCIGATTCSDQPDPYGIVEIVETEPDEGDGGSDDGGSDDGGSDDGGSDDGGSDDGGSNDDGSGDDSDMADGGDDSTDPPDEGDDMPGDGSGVAFRVDGEGNITKNGEPFPVQCSAWFGLEGQYEPNDAENNPGGAPMELYVGNMWWANTGRTIEQTMEEITAQGINTIRLPIAPQTLNPNDPQGSGDIRSGGVLKNHESVRQDNARQALEDFIVKADQHDLNVIVDVHGCSNFVGWRSGRLDATPPWVDADRENYEFKREDFSCGPVDDPSITVHPYNEELWLEDLREIAGLSEDLGVDNIMAIDIFNEPWDYTWDEWSTLAETAYQAIDEVNSDILVMVEGIAAGTSDGTPVPHGDEASNPNWGENFFSFQDDPLDIPKERLILSPHTYGPSVFVQKQFMDPAQPECEGLEGREAAEAGCNIVIEPERLEAGWQEHFGFLADQNYAVVIGEFGGLFDWPNGAEERVQDHWDHIDPAAGVDEQWQNAAVDYFNKKGIQGCYWSTNPESTDTGGLYQHAWDPETNPGGWGTWEGFEERKWNLLNRLWED